MATAVAAPPSPPPPPGDGGHTAAHPTEPPENGGWEALRAWVRHRLSTPAKVVGATYLIGDAFVFLSAMLTPGPDGRRFNMNKAIAGVLGAAQSAAFLMDQDLPPAITEEQANQAIAQFDKHLQAISLQEGKAVLSMQADVANSASAAVKDNAERIGSAVMAAAGVSTVVGSTRKIIHPDGREEQVRNWGEMLNGLMNSFGFGILVWNPLRRLIPDSWVQGSKRAEEHAKERAEREAKVAATSVEDSQITRESLGYDPIAEVEGYAEATRESVRQGWDAFRENPVQFIVQGIREQLHGLLYDLKENESAAATKVLSLTSLAGLTGGLQDIVQGKVNPLAGVTQMVGSSFYLLGEFMLNSMSRFKEIRAQVRNIIAPKENAVILAEKRMGRIIFTINYWWWWRKSNRTLLR